MRQAINLKQITFFLLLLLFSSKMSLAQEINVVVYNAPPLIYQDENGVPKGVFIDILNEIAVKENWKLNYKYYEIADIFNGIRRQEIDIIPDVIKKSTDSLHFGAESVLSSWGKLYFSKNFYAENITELNGKTIVLQAGDHIVEGADNGFKKLLSSFNIKVKILNVKTYEEVFQTLKEGRAHAGVVNRIFGDLNYESYGLKKSEIIFSPVTLTFAAPANNQQAIDYITIIDTYIKQFKKNRNSIYFISLDKHLISTKYDFIPQWLVTTLLIIGLLIVILLASSFFMRRQIAKKTNELSKTNLQLSQNTGKIEKINQELIESNRKFSTLISNLRGVVFRAKNERAWPMEFISDGVLELTGYKADTFTNSTGFTWLSVIYHEDMSYVWNQIQTLLQQQKSYEISYRIINSEGQIKWVNEKGEAVLNEFDKIIAVEGFITDITLFKEKEIELTKHKENLEKIVAKRTREITTKHSELSSFNSELSVINEQLVVEIADRKLAQERSLKLSDELQEINVQLEERQEEILQQAEVLAITNQELEHKKTALEEILAELKNAQSKLIQSEKMATVGQLTAGIAHEINNPVNFINAGIDSLEIILNDIMLVVKHYSEIDNTNLSEKLEQINTLKEQLNYNKLIEGVEKLTKNIKTGAVRTTQIVKSLRLFSRLDESDIKFVDLHENIDSTLVMLQNKYKNRINIIKDYNKFAMLECFPGKINQVFMNLLVNAIDSIPEKGDITIKTGVSEEKYEGKPKFVYISIKDTGVGMSPEVMSRIFEPFFTTKEIGKGTGLGLSISYSIIEDHNGEIEVFSEIGKGTEFFITLPVTSQLANTKSKTQ